MNNVQLNYLNTLKIAVSYLKSNKNLDNAQLAKVFNKIKAAEFKGLKSKYKIESLNIPSKCLNTHKTIDDYELSYLVKPAFNKYAKKYELITFEIEILSPKYYLHKLEKQDFSEVCKYVGNFDIRRIMKFVLCSFIAFSLLISGFIASNILMGILLWTLIIPVSVYAFMNPTFQSTKIFNKHYTTEKEFTDIVQYALDSYTQEIKQTSINKNDMETIKSNHTDWESLYKKASSKNDSRTVAKEYCQKLREIKNKAKQEVSDDFDNDTTEQDIEREMLYDK